MIKYCSTKSNILEISSKYQTTELPESPCLFISLKIGFKVYHEVAAYTGLIQKEIIYNQRF